MTIIGRMVKLIRYLLEFVGVKPAKNKHPVSHIEGADNVIVDSSVICCPICYNVYSSVPSILPCGHTFCGSCIRNMSTRDNLTTMVNHEWIILCPMCREACCTKRIIKNYIVEDLLQKISEMPEDPAQLDNLKLTTTRLAKQRYENKCNELEQQNNRLSNELAELRKKELRNYIGVAVFVLSYILLTTIYGT